MGPAWGWSWAQAPGPGPYFVLDIGPRSREGGRLNSKTRQSQTWYISNMISRLPGLMHLVSRNPWYQETRQQKCRGTKRACESRGCLCLETRMGRGTALHWPSIYLVTSFLVHSRTEPTVSFFINCSVLERARDSSGCIGIAEISPGTCSE